jgi:hypothetical protein
VAFTGPSDSPDGTAPAYPASVTFAGGVGTAAVTVFDAETTTLTATQGTLAGTSGTFTVSSPSQDTETSNLIGVQTHHVRDLMTRLGTKASLPVWQVLAQTL